MNAMIAGPSTQPVRRVSNGHMALEESKWLCLKVVYFIHNASAGLDILRPSNSRIQTKTKKCTEEGVTDIKAHFLLGGVH